MGKLGCQCGNVMSDVSDNLPYKAQLVPDQYFYDFFERIESAIKDLIEATRNGKREEWVMKNFNFPPYPLDLRDEQMISDIFGKYYFDLKKDIFQCEKCGRIHIEKERNHFVSFLPEDDRWRDILSKRNANEKR
jgi:hypothetical protein